MNQRRISTNNLFDQLIGFQDLEDKVFQNTYPPHDIVQIDDDIQIDLAIAGYTKESVSITMNDGVLSVVGDVSSDENDNKKYHKRGISKKKFHLAWSVSSQYEVQEAELENGILSIILKRREDAKPKTINIK